jgi:hypothetical protein
MWLTLGAGNGVLVPDWSVAGNWPILLAETPCLVSEGVAATGGD